MKSYTPEELNNPKHKSAALAAAVKRVNGRAMAVREYHRKVDEILEPLIKSRTDGTVSAGKVQIDGKKFDVRYSERHP